MCEPTSILYPNTIQKKIHSKSYFYINYHLYLIKRKVNCFSVIDGLKDVRSDCLLQ